MKYSIDRIEESIVVIQNIENAEKKEIEITELPENIKEGDILSLIDDKYIIDNETTNKRKNKINDRFSKLIKK